MNQKVITLLLSIILTASICAQSGSYGTWTALSVDKKLNKWDVSAETELRTVYLTRLVERISLGVGADYGIMKGLKIGAGYQLMSKLDTKYLNYQLRNRFNVSTTGKLKLNDLTLSLRERVQITTKDESKRIRENGSIDDYKVNPEWSWRNRLQMSYNIPNFKITPTLSVETFYQLNNPDGNEFDNIRYTLAFDYKIKKKHIVEIYGLINSALDSDDAYGKYILGAAYKYSF